MIHELKILPQYFEAVQAGLKNFEIRQNDRGFKEGDTLILKEFEIGEENSIDLRVETGYTGRETTKEISYILEGGKYGLEEGYCIASLKQEGIILRNINLTGISKEEQWEKMSEEESEFVEAFFEYENNKTEENKNHLIEEFFDTIQSALGVLEKEGIKADEVMKEYSKHIEKLKNRPRHKEE